MKKALYAGSFDPFTKGHLDILEQADEIFDKVYIIIGNNPKKKYFFNLDYRLNIIRNDTQHLKNVETAVLEKGLIVNEAEKLKARWLIRGIRQHIDFDHEFTLNATNNKINSSVSTLMIFSKPENMFISSSAFREIYKNGGDISWLVSEYTQKLIRKKI